MPSPGSKNESQALGHSAVGLVQLRDQAEKHYPWRGSCPPGSRDWGSTVLQTFSHLYHCVVTVERLQCRYDLTNQILYNLHLNHLQARSLPLPPQLSFSTVFQNLLLRVPNENVSCFVRGNPWIGWVLCRGAQAQPPIANHSSPWFINNIRRRPLPGSLVYFSNSSSACLLPIILLDLA